MLRKSLVSLALAGLVSVPTVGHAAARTSTPAGSSQELVNSGNWIVLLAALALAIGGAVLLIDEDDETPASP